MFRSHHVWSLLQPRRPRHPIVRGVLWILAVGVLLVLLAVGAVVGVAVLAGSLLLRALRPSRPVAIATPPAADPSVIDGDFTVLRKPVHHVTNH